MLSKVASSMVSLSCLLALLLALLLLGAAGDAEGPPPCCFAPALPAPLVCLPSSLSTWLAFLSLGLLAGLALGLLGCWAGALLLPACCEGEGEGVASALLVSFFFSP
jgi:hypothetical protein